MISDPDFSGRFAAAAPTRSRPLGSNDNLHRTVQRIRALARERGRHQPGDARAVLDEIVHHSQPGCAARPVSRTRSIFGSVG